MGSENDLEPQSLKNHAEYERALKEIDSLMSAEKGTVEGSRLQYLAKLVQAYEARHFPMVPSANPSNDA